MGNPLPRFIEESCSTGSASKYRYRRSEFHNDLKAWLSQQDVRWSPSAQQVGEQMKQLGYAARKRQGEWFYVGLVKGSGRASLSILDGGAPPDAEKQPGDEFKDGDE